VRSADPSADGRRSTRVELPSAGGISSRRGDTLLFSGRFGHFNGAFIIPSLSKR